GGRSNGRAQEGSTRGGEEGAGLEQRKNGPSTEGLMGHAEKGRKGVAVGGGGARSDAWQGKKESCKTGLQGSRRSCHQGVGESKGPEPAYKKEGRGRE
ncbi:hypothetical protein GOP47_0000138, partial [Adiantum capillus-veneris]